MFKTRRTSHVIITTSRLTGIGLQILDKNYWYDLKLIIALQMEFIFPYQFETCHCYSKPRNYDLNGTLNDVFKCMYILQDFSNSEKAFAVTTRICTMNLIIQRLKVNKINQFIRCNFAPKTD